LKAYADNQFNAKPGIAFACKPDSCIKTAGVYYILTKLGIPRGPDRNAWQAGLWPAGRMLDTPAMKHQSCVLGNMKGIWPVATIPKCLLLGSDLTRSNSRKTGRLEIIAFTLDCIDVYKHL